MTAQEGGAPAWLFSFVDLAFLMLIAMTQVAGDVAADAPNLGEMIVPSIGEKGAPGELSREASRTWQLRIHPPTLAGEPFELISPAAQAAESSEVETAQSAQSAQSADWATGNSQPPLRIGRESLVLELDRLTSTLVTKPLLIPHEDSRSQDLLDAVAVLEERWPTRRRALVARLPVR